MDKSLEFYIGEAGHQLLSCLISGAVHSQLCVGFDMWHKNKRFYVNERTSRLLQSNTCDTQCL